MPSERKSTARQVKTGQGRQDGSLSPSSVVERFASLFSGYERMRGAFVVKGADEKGKVTGKAATLRGGATLEHYTAHLAGEQGLGVIMLREDNTVNFAAIDYDNRKMDHAKAFAKIQMLKLPLVLCRSKSGGGHFYCFTQEPIPATLMRERLDEWTAMLGFSASTEKFPKQTTRFSPEDVGSWINLPYFGGDREDQERYAIGPNGPLKLAEFLDYAESHRATLAQLQQPAYAPSDDESDLFYEGPPCLQVLHRQGGLPEGARNDGMVAVITYLKKRYPDSWEEHVDRYNQEMGQRNSRELTELVKGLSKKDYAYRCQQQPLKDVCQRRTCIRRMYGVGQGDPESQGITLSGLTRYDLPNGDEPLWGVEVNGRRVVLTNNQLYSRDDFNRACMAQANALPVHMAPARWLKYLGELIPKADIIALPEDAGPSGQLWERIVEFCQQKASAQAKDEILLGKPWRENGKLYFRSTDLFRYLDARRVAYKSPQQVWHLLNSKGAERDFWKVSGRGVNVWSLPIPDGQAPRLAPLPELHEDAL